MTLKELSERTDLSISTLSPIKNGQMSLTYDNTLAIANALHISLVDLLGQTNGVPRTRRSIVQLGVGDVYGTNVYHYKMLHTDLTARQMTPILARLKAGSIAEFGRLKVHPGKELFVVMQGSAELHCEHYAPVTLEVSDGAYFDSTMGHALLASGEAACESIWIATNSRINLRLTQVDFGDASENSTSGIAKCSKVCQSIYSPCRA